MLLKDPELRYHFPRISVWLSLPQHLLQYPKPTTGRGACIRWSTRAIRSSGSRSWRTCLTPSVCGHTKIGRPGKKFDPPDQRHGQTFLFKIAEHRQRANDKSNNTMVRVSDVEASEMEHVCDKAEIWSGTLEKKLVIMTENLTISLSSTPASLSDWLKEASVSQGSTPGIQNSHRWAGWLAARNVWSKALGSEHRKCPINAELPTLTSS